MLAQKLASSSLVYLLQDYFPARLTELIIEYISPRCALLYGDSTIIQFDNLVDMQQLEPKRYFEKIFSICKLTRGFECLVAGAKLMENENERCFVSLSTLHTNLVFTGEDDYGINRMQVMYDNVLAQPGKEFRPPRRAHDRGDYCTVRCATTENNLIWALQKIEHQTSDCRFSSSDIYLFDQEHNKWLHEAHTEDASQAIGLCGSNKWFVLSHAYFFLIFNRTTQTWKTLHFDRNHCRCFSLMHMIINEDMLILFPESYSDGEINMKIYDLNTLDSILSKHNNCYFAKPFYLTESHALQSVLLY